MGSEERKYMPAVTMSPNERQNIFCEIIRDNPKFTATEIMYEYERLTGYKRNIFYIDRRVLINKVKIRTISKGSRRYYTLIEDKKTIKKEKHYSVRYKKGAGRKLMTTFFPPIEDNTK